MAKRRETRYIVIHCAATPPDMVVTAEMVDRWHKQNGWAGIGYHYLIRRDGMIEPGRPIDDQGAHVSGHNQYSVGICLAGGIDSRKRPENNFTPQQWASLKAILRQLRGIYPSARILGHKDLNPGKACPCFDVAAWLRQEGI